MALQPIPRLVECWPGRGGQILKIFRKKKTQSFRNILFIFLSLFILQSYGGGVASSVTRGYQPNSVNMYTRYNVFINYCVFFQRFKNIADSGISLFSLGVSVCTH